MKYTVLLFCVSVLALSAQAQATGAARLGIGSGTFKLDDDDSPDDFKGDLTAYDFRASVDVSSNVFLRGEYTLHSIDKVKSQGVKYDTDIDIDTLRLGAGYGGNVGSIRLYGAAEYINLRIKIEGDSENENGWAISGGIGDQGRTALLWNVELSLLDVDGTGGACLDATIGYRFTPWFNGVVGVQSYSFQDNSTELDFGAAYLGVQVAF